MADEGKRYREAEDPIKYLINLRKRKERIERDFNAARDAGDFERAKKCAERFYEIGFEYHQTACEMIGDFATMLREENNPAKRASIQKLQNRLIGLANLVNEKIGNDPDLPEK